MPVGAGRTIQLETGKRLREAVDGAFMRVLAAPCPVKDGRETLLKATRRYVLFGPDRRRNGKDVGGADHVQRVVAEPGAGAVLHRGQPCLGMLAVLPCQRKFGVNAPGDFGDGQALAFAGRLASSRAILS